MLWITALRRFSQRALSCWKCHTSQKTNSFFCNSCNSILPPSTDNLFKYIGVPEQFALDDTTLKKKFLQLQSQLHPDKFGHLSQDETNISEEHSRLLNKAYSTLSQPLPRAKYLLRLLEDGKKEAISVGDEWLMEMMEWNERIDELSDRMEFEKERIEVQNAIDCILKQLGPLFSSKKWAEVRNSISRLSYLYSIRSTIDGHIEKRLNQ